MVWCVCALPGGDLVTGCQDGVVRLWTRNPGQLAPDGEVALFEEQVAAQSLAAQQVGGVDVD
eukprot:SAG22_NODE_35_length_27276_cov_20.395849_10_plen_62_part_00